MGTTKKIFVSFLLCFSLLLNLSVPAWAASNPKSVEQNGIIYTNNSIETVLTPQQAKPYEIYEVNAENIPRSLTGKEMSVKETVLTICSFEKTRTIGEYQVDAYSSSDLHKYLYNCDNITDIYMVQGYLFVHYITTDGESVVLSYDDSGLKTKTVYNPASDIAVIEEFGVVTKYENFKNAFSVEISQPVLDQIDQYISEQNWEALQSMEGISVTIDNQGFVSVVPANMQQSRSWNEGFSSYEQLLADFAEEFPPYTNALKMGCTRYVAALDKNVNIRVRESCNSYVRKTAVGKWFALGTTLTTLSAWYSVVTAVSVTNVAVAVILAAAGIAVSLGDILERHILQDATLYYTATYRYTLERVGYAYDETIFEDYVRVVTYSGVGEFTGGYQVSGEFSWVQTGRPATLDHSYSEIADLTAYNYNSDITLHGGCLNYYPDGL